MTRPAEPPAEEPVPLRIILAALYSLLMSAAPLAAFLYILGRLGRAVSKQALRNWLRPDGDLAGSIRLDEFPVPGWPEPLYQQFNQNVHRRSSYLVNAARRMSRAFIDGDFAGGYARETRYWDQHRHAAKNRMDSAQQVADQQARYSEVRLGWHAMMDERTSAECRAAHGRDFDPNRIPPIGYPGSVHPHCRCRAGAPWFSGRRVESIRPHQR